MVCRIDLKPEPLDSVRSLLYSKTCAAAKTEAKEAAAFAKKAKKAAKKAGVYAKKAEEEVTAKKAEEAAAAKKAEEAAAAAAKKAEEAAAAKSVMEIEGLAAAVARVKLGGDVLTRAAAWIAAAGAQSVAQLEPDDIDGALFFALALSAVHSMCDNAGARAHTHTRASISISSST